MIMADRASAKAKCTNDDLELLTDSSDDSEEEEEEVSNEPSPANEADDKSTNSVSSDSAKGSQENSTPSRNTTNVVATSGDSGVAVASTKISIAERKSTSSSAKKKKRRRGAGHQDDVLTSGFERFTEAAAKRKKESLAETRRHNLRMEELAQWKGKQEQLSYKMDLLERYKFLLQQNHSKAWIQRTFPEMSIFLEEDE